MYCRRVALVAQFEKLTEAEVIERVKAEVERRRLQPPHPGGAGYLTGCA